MKKISWSLLPVLALTLGACSSRPKKEDSSSVRKEEEAKVGKTWDYDRIREARSAEAAAEPNKDQAKQMHDSDADCLVMSRSQMIRSKAQGCRPVEAQAGLGEDSYCCPR